MPKGRPGERTVPCAMGGHIMNTATGGTGLIIDECFERHDTGSAHPERPARLRAIRDRFRAEGLTDCCPTVALREATDDEILSVHSAEYLERLRQACEAGRPYIDTPDSAICPESYQLARLAAGSVLAAADQVVSGSLRNAFCAVRPPGHHCERSTSMGFCMLGNVAIAARYLLDRHGLERVAVLDWDVHHGNGTQHLFEDTAAVFYCSLHGHPEYVYPGTGFEHERGSGPGEGATLNLPMYPGSGDDDYKRAFDERVLPALENYRPRFVLISAGFDAHRLDPLAPLNLESQSYAWMTRAVMDLAEEYADGRIVSVLEGGYDLDALAESAMLHVQGLMT